MNLKWINPLDGVITSNFGDRDNPISDKEELHNGIDIGVAERTNILSVANGIVTEVGNVNTYGNYVKYKVDNYTIMYAHCNKILVKEGDYIKQGQILALSGNTGMSTGAHLHYSIWYDEELLDPLPFLNLDI